MSGEDDDRVFRALADPVRRQVLDALRRVPLTTGAAARLFPDITRFAVMKHLRVLEEAGLLVAVRRGRECLNHLNPVPIRRIYRRFIRTFEEDGADALLRLQRVAERGETA
jgi:DNA-binding transcriptional ArsR family regulator